MSLACAKCKSDSVVKGKTYVEASETYYLCKICSIIMDKLPTNIFHMFLQEDSSSFEEISSRITPIEKNILAGKERRLKKGSLFLEWYNPLKMIEGGFFPPPWDMSENPEKTEGWIEFQKAQRRGDFDSLKDLIS